VARAVIDPFAEFLRPISPIAWIPLAILLFGVGGAVPVFLIFYAAVFPIFVGTLDGIRRVDRNLVNAARALGASRATLATRVILPAALPAIFAGARLSLGVAWMALVAGEIVGGDAGIGWRILWYQEFFQMDRVLAMILVVGALGLAADSLLRVLQRRLLRWHPTVELPA
jgi:ABC-type nitrate/sulfonate/bicarbonate transport system permease component